MKLRLIVILLTIVSSLSFGQTFPTDTLVFNGPGEKRINLVFLGDGYLATDMDKYLVDVQRIVDKFSITSPFEEYLNHFNIIIIKVPSNEQGAARDPSALIDNYFGSTYNYAGIDRLLVPTKTDVVASVLADNFPQYDQAFVVVNDSKYGGSGGWLATASTNLASIDVPIHEIGHSLANLADEYWAGFNYARERPNLTAESNPSLVKWTNWMGEPGVGAWEHPTNTRWFKPYRDCKMERNGSPFCPVCKERFVQVFHELTKKIDDYSPKQLTGLNDPHQFDIAPLEPSPNTLKTWWLLNGDTLAKNSNTASLSLSDLIPDQNELTMTIVDTTAFSRHEELIAQSISWFFDSSTNPIGITSVQSDLVINRSDLEPDIVTAIEDPFIQEIGLKTYPNPVSDLLSVTFRNINPVKFSMRIIEMSGSTLNSVPQRLLAPGDQRFEINTSKLQKGLFLLQMTVGEKLIIHKILKN